MKARAEVARFVEDQFSDDYALVRSKHGRVHYGVQEARELLDFIYDEEPQTEDEEINK